MNFKASFIAVMLCMPLWSFDELPKELFEKIIHHMNPQDAWVFRLVSSAYSKRIFDYFQNQISQHACTSKYEPALKKFIINNKYIFDSKNGFCGIFSKKNTQPMELEPFFTIKKSYDEFYTPISILDIKVDNKITEIMLKEVLLCSYNSEKIVFSHLNGVSIYHVLTDELKQFNINYPIAFCLKEGFCIQQKTALRFYNDDCMLQKTIQVLQNSVSGSGNEVCFITVENKKRCVTFTEGF